MYINFEDVNVLASIGIDYFSHSKEGLINLDETEYRDLFNQWATYEGSNGADIRCTVVHLGKRLSGNIKRCRIAVYECDNQFESLVLFPLSMIKEAIATMNAMAGHGELVCCE